MDIFVYGTLRSPRLLQVVIGSYQWAQEPAELHGYAVGSVQDDVVPHINAVQGSVTAGLCLYGLNDQQIERIDRYESAFGYKRIEVDVEVLNGQRKVGLYLPPAGLGYTSEPWSLDHWIEQYEKTAVLTAQEVFSHEPPLSAPEIRARWRSIQGRSWSTTLARSDPAPTQVRYAGQQGDYSVKWSNRPAGDFYRFESFELEHKLFDRSKSAKVNREGFVGFDAALVLPYDPHRDRVLLVEQLRVGPTLRGDPNPWVLEPVAGMVDPYEQPETAARREAIEEAHLTEIDLHKIGQVYASPGGSTDYFYLYAGLCDLPDTHPRSGGLESEAEDLRLHLLDREQAMGLVHSGEVNVGPLLTMLFWLEMNYKQLGATA